MIPSPEVIADILQEYKRTRSPFKAANAVGVDVSVVWAVIDENKDKLSSFEERNGGKGRPELEKYLVASRRANEKGWDNKDVGIVRAREAYEAGTHEMCTGRDGAWLLLYLIPRRYPTPTRKGYFILENA